MCFAHEDGTLYAGDAAGVRIAPSRLVLPPTPPPDIDVVAWYATLDELERRAPKQLALVHFGVFDDVARHLSELRERLGEWEQIVEGGATQDEFVERVHAGLGELDDDDLQAVERAMPMWQSYAGLKRWVDKSQAQPVTSHRFRVKRTPSAARRTQIRTSSADQTPTMPQS